LAVLIVEDEPWLSLDISEALEDDGYDVIAVAHADNAIEALGPQRHPHLVHGPRCAFYGWIETGCRRERTLPPVNIIVN